MSPSLVSMRQHHRSCLQWSGIMTSRRQHVKHTQHCSGSGSGSNTCIEKRLLAKPYCGIDQVTCHAARQLIRTSRPFLSRAQDTHKQANGVTTHPHIWPLVGQGMKVRPLLQSVIACHMEHCGLDSGPLPITGAITAPSVGDSLPPFTGACSIQGQTNILCCTHIVDVS